jgi:hypothetical protein
MIKIAGPRKAFEAVSAEGDKFLEVLVICFFMATVTWPN